MLQPVFFSVFLYSVQNWGLYLVLLQCLLLHFSTNATSSWNLHACCILIPFIWCFLWKFSLFLWPHFRCTWVCFWRVGPCDSSGSFVFMSLMRVLQLGYAARLRQGSGFDSRAEHICLFFTTCPPSHLYNGYPGLFPRGEAVTGTCTLCPPYVFISCFVIGYKELEV